MARAQTTAVNAATSPSGADAEGGVLGTVSVVGGEGVIVNVAISSIVLPALVGAHDWQKTINA